MKIVNFPIQDEALAFVQKSVAHAMARDGSSGGMVRTLVISADGVAIHDENYTTWCFCSLVISICVIFMIFFENFG